MKSEQNVDVSIVIPAFNEESCLFACLSAIGAQVTKHQIEVIVVDNGSTDRTREIAQQHGVVVVEEPAKGVGSARKAGTEHARGMYVLHIDADTQLPVSFVEDAVARFQADSSLVCLGGQMVWYDAGACANMVRGVLFWLLVPLVRVISRGALGPMGNNMMFLRSTYLLCNGFDQSLRFGEDADLTRQLRAHGRVTLDRSLTCPTSSRRYRWNKNLAVYLWNATRLCLGCSPRSYELPSLTNEHKHSGSSIDR
jgi:glycosyltransferase involved in cell wall biosynthesis